MKASKKYTNTLFLDMFSLSTENGFFSLEVLSQVIKSKEAFFHLT